MAAPKWILPFLWISNLFLCRTRSKTFPMFFFSEGSRLSWWRLCSSSSWSFQLVIFIKPFPLIFGARIFSYRRMSTHLHCADFFLGHVCVNLTGKVPTDYEMFSRITITAPWPSSLPLSHQEGVIRLWEIFKNNHHCTWTILSSIILSRRSHQIVRDFQDWSSQSPWPSSPPWSHREDPRAPPLWLPPPPEWGSGCWFAPSVSRLKKAWNVCYGINQSIIQLMFRYTALRI